MIFESGVIDARPSRLVLTMGDPALATNAAMLVDMPDIFGLTLQRGLVDIGFLGAAQVDKRGNLNSSVVGDYSNPKVRLPGSGGACETASLAKRFVVIMPHERRRIVEKVDFVTSPGNIEGRREKGIRGGGPDAVITTLGICRFDERGDMQVESIHPGVSKEEIEKNTGWPIRFAKQVKETEPPSREQLEILRNELDPKRILLGKQVD
jgi:glutaconate CoA-transferase subunit B